MKLERLSDLIVIKNQDNTHTILKNRNGENNVVVSDMEFRKILARSSEPIVINSKVLEAAPCLT